MQKDRWRLKLHLMPPNGWLNDPNGLCQFQGEYHVFFQYSPGEPEGGLKHWGHYVSPDLLHWVYVGVALSPEEVFESGGVYSGSAFVKNDTMYLYYTGNVKLSGEYNYITNGRQGNTVLVTSEDGKTFGKKECLMTNSDYPLNLTCHVRDPKVVSAESLGRKDDYVYMLLGARKLEDKGEVLLYRSHDLRQWELVQEIGSEEKMGYMWECPDVFCLNGQTILSISPQGVESEELNYQNLYQSGYYLVEGDLTASYRLDTFKEWDRGFDFYAPQTFEDEKGRRILIGWIGMPDVPEHQNPTVEYGWQNALTVPREVIMKQGRIKQYPIEELKTLRKEKWILQPNEKSKMMECYDVEIKVNPEENLEIMIADSICLRYERTKSIFSLTFDERAEAGYGRKSRSVRLEQCNTVRMLMDTSCMEIYLNDGEEVFTSRFYTRNGKSNFRVQNAGAEIKYWQMDALEILMKKQP